MTFRSVIDLLELLDDGRTTGAQVAEYLSALGSAKVSVKRVEGDKPGTFTPTRILKKVVARRPFLLCLTLRPSCGSREDSRHYGA